jgi:hypothetical protein
MESGLTPVLRMSLVAKDGVRPCLDPNCGFLSATDSRLFPGFQILYSSIILKHQTSVCVVDLGMEDDQRDWCRQQKNLLIVKPKTEIFKLHNQIYDWQKFNKPYYFLFSPFKKTLWLDCDTIVLKDVSALFNMMDEDPVICSGFSKINKDEFIEDMDGHYDSPKNCYYPETGMIGINLEHDFWLLRDWLWATLKAASDCRLLSNLRHVDAGCLAWALVKHDRIRSMLDSMTWCWNAALMGGRDGRQFYPSAAEMLSTVDLDYHMASILHWKGFAKPFLFWGDRILNLYPEELIA